MSKKHKKSLHKSTTNKALSPSREQLLIRVGRLEERVKHLTRNRRFSLAELSVRWVGRIAIAWIIIYWFKELAGRRTELFADLDLATDVNGSVELGTSDPIFFGIVLFLLVLSGGAILYGKSQRKLRGQAIRALSNYRVKYEASIDPKRSSSELTDLGNTREEDQ